MDAQQKCVTNLAATVVRQDQQIRQLKSQIRSLESASGRSLGSSGALQHSRTSSDVVSDTNTTDSTCSSERGSSGCIELSSKDSQASVWSSVLEAEEELRSLLVESKKILARMKSPHGKSKGKHGSQRARGAGVHISTSSSGSSFGGH